MGIRLGYEIGAGNAVDIPGDRHMAISGQTQRSGKTTTLEALIHRASQNSRMRAVAFVTKRAEGSFRSAHQVPPFFTDSAHWQFVASILEAILGEKMKMERAQIIECCRGAKGLRDVHAEVKRRLHGQRNAEWEEWSARKSEHRSGKRGPKIGKEPREWNRKPATGFNADMLIQLDAYLDIVVPQLDKLEGEQSKTLELEPGLNVMDLSEYSTELQQLVIRSVLEWVYEREKNTVVIIPEAWEFIPQNRRSPVLLAAEELIRKGAAAGNYVWLDSQDIAAVHKNVLRSVGVWILGVQRELNEVKRTLGYVQGGGSIRAEQVMGLGRGQFFAAWDQRVVKVYVQPFWISDAHAAAIARGEETVESAEKIWRERKATEAQKHRDSAVSPPNVGAVPHMAADRSGPVAAVPPAPQLLQIQEQTSDERSTEETASPSAEAPPLDREEITRGSEDARSAAGLRVARASGPLSRTNETGGENEEEEMWKGRALEAEGVIRDLIADGILSQGTLGIYTEIAKGSASTDNPEMKKKAELVASLSGNVQSIAIDRFTDAGYERLKRRLLDDQEVLVVLDSMRPEIKINFVRPVVQMDDSTLKGRIARLAAEGFFKSPRPAGDVLKEAQRRGWMNQNNRSNHVAIPLSELTEMGLLTREDAGYQLVRSCKITEAKA